MKNKIVLLLIAAAGLLMHSCSKSGTGDLPYPPDKPYFKEGGEDDDRPIIITRIINFALQPIGGANVVLYSEHDTVSTYTDDNGMSEIPLPRFGSWHYSVRMHDEVYLNTNLLLTEPLYYRTDTLSL